MIIVMTIVLPLLLTTAIYCGLVVLAQLAARYFVGSGLVWMVGSLAVLFIVYSVVQTKLGCDNEPRFILPDCKNGDVCGEGQMVFACDGPSGAIAYGFMYFFGPLTVVLVSIFTYVVAKRPRKKLEA
jgi:hypothetical protein